MRDFLSSAKLEQAYTFEVIVDPRFNYSDFISNNIVFTVTPILRRFLVDLYIKRKLDKETIVIYLGNLPPLIKIADNVILLQSNRFLIENYPLNGLAFKTKIRIGLERLQVKYFSKNVKYTVVQSLSMKDLLVNSGRKAEVVSVLPYKNFDKILVDQPVSNRKIHNFIYVAAGEHYKNHINLMKAWKILQEEGYDIKLFVTLEKGMTTYQENKNYVSNNKLNVEFVKLTRSELLDLYAKMDALIYPSLFESYGLPLVEAQSFQLPIIASELDYVRDMLDPVASFDPHSPRSISRAVKRFIDKDVKQYKIISGTEFINTIREMV